MDDHVVRIVANHRVTNHLVVHFMVNDRFVRLIVDGHALHASGTSVIGRVVQPVVGSRGICAGVDGRGVVVVGGGGLGGGGGSETGALFVPFVYRRPAVGG
ncbi:hypothetical protein [Nonomuraea sp. NPDC001831]|uniref:hypothetical protein n=1 Tax=Nonomuraea sp. NPDC001831 TaxID=3364340 RepID=UPI0036CA1EE3